MFYNSISDSFCYKKSSGEIRGTLVCGRVPRTLLSSKNSIARRSYAALRERRVGRGTEALAKTPNIVKF